MTKHFEKNDSDLIDALDRFIAEQKQQNKHSTKRNALSQQKLQLDQLRLDQAERLYLLEKSKLQASFKLSVTEFLLCEPNFMVDPEQAGEAKFLTDLGVEIDERVLRLQVTVVQKGQILRPRLVIKNNHKKNSDDLAFAMSEKLYFLPVKRLCEGVSTQAFDAYWVYHDQTTLPVLQKYRISQQQDSSLARWNVVHEDTVFALAKHSLDTLNLSDGCQSLFDDRF